MYRYNKRIRNFEKKSFYKNKLENQSQRIKELGELKNKRELEKYRVKVGKICTKSLENKRLTAMPYSQKF